MTCQAKNNSASPLMIQHVHLSPHIPKLKELGIPEKC